MGHFHGADVSQCLEPSMAQLWIILSSKEQSLFPEKEYEVVVTFCCPYRLREKISCVFLSVTAQFYGNYSILRTYSLPLKFELLDFSTLS